MEFAGFGALRLVRGNASFRFPGLPPVLMLLGSGEEVLGSFAFLVHLQFACPPQRDAQGTRLVPNLDYSVPNRNQAQVAEQEAGL